ncbi:hypothetical protein A4X13_0g3025 [Tilletia indica]|uniref:Uncharacterized protein n=1 Tax=Tilletia indica TaxID=43049 RepID=A0A177TGN7_9BASI|nr:hypothetical protein A4X13_0g3025 [Tilletia indica]
MAYTYSSYAGSLRPESSLPTIEEGLSHLQDSSNSEDAIHQLRNQQHIIHSPKNSNFLPPGHQSPTTRIVSGGSSSSGTAVDRISADGKPPRSRHGTADSMISNGSNISLNESELFRGAQYALAHLQESIHSQESEHTATSVALSQHYRHAHLDRTERIEDANLTGISQVPKTPGSTTRRAYGNDMVESPSLPSSLRNALATPRSKSVTFAPSPPGSPSPAQQQDAASEISASSEPEIDGLSTSEQAMLSEWTRIPPSESSPPSSRSIARNSPRRSPSPLDAPLQQQQSEVEIQPEAEVESQFAVESSPSPSPRSSSALLRTNRRSISPSLHTSVAHTPSRLRNVVTLTDTESSVDSNHAPEEEEEDLSHERTPPPSRPSSRQAHSSPHRLSRTPVQSLPQPPTAFLPIPFSSPLAQSLTQAKSPATLTGISTGTAVTAGTGTFATAESFQTTPSSTGTRTSTLSGTKEAGDSHELLQGLPPPRFPSLFGADTSFSVERDEEPVIEEEEQKEELKEEEEEDEMVRSIEDSLSRLTRAAQLISSATASAFAQIGGRRAADTEIQDKLEEEEEAAGETSQTIEELAHGANLVQEMHELHAALQANLLRRLQAAERGQAREREERVQLEGNVKRLVVGLMKGDSVSGEEDGALAEEGEEMEMLFGKFRAWALHMGSMKDRLENSNSVGPEPASTSRSSNSKTETDRLLSLQSELDRLSAELEIAEQAHLTIQARVAEVESERDELKDEQGVFELELSNARRERDQIRSEAEDVAEELSLAQRRISVLEVQVAEESAGRSQADAYRRRLEEGFEAQLADLRRELEDLRRENVGLEEGRRQVEERGREEVGGAVRALREREREVEKLLSDLETERQIRARLEGEREELIAAIPIPDEKDDEDALLASKLEEAEGKVGLQASRIKELEKESANADLEIAKLLKVRDRMEQENANYAMALAAKQQELSLLKRNTGRTSAANMTAAAAATPLGLKTPRANDKHRKDQADPLSTVRRRPPTAVLQSLILNTETPLPSSRIAHRSRISGLHQASSGKEDAYTTTTEEEEEERSEIGDEVTPLRAGQGLTKGSRVLGERGVPASSSNGAASKPRLSSRASLGSAVRASRVGVNDENAPPPPPPLPSRGSSATSSTGTSLNGGGGARRARSSLGAGALSSTATSSAAATRASTVGARRTSLGVAGNSSSRTERPSRAIAPSPTPSMASVTSTSSVASSGYTSTSTSNSIASTSTRTGVLRSAAAARKSGVGVDSRMMASTPTPASASASGRGASSGSVLGRERIVNRPRESGVRVASGSSSSVRASGSKAATTSVGPSSSSARTALKRSSPDEEPEPIKAIPQQQHHHSASASAASSSSRSTVVPRLSRTQQLGASSLSTHSLSQSSRSVSNGSVRDEEMTEEELSGSVGPMMPSASGSGASLGARRVVSGRLSDVASSRAGPSGLRPGSSVPGGARRPSYGLAGSAARVPSYERRMLPA